MTTPTPTATVRKLGPGVCQIGAVGSALDFAPRATKAAITWKEKATDDTVVLSGDVMDGNTTYDATLELTVFQDDLTTGGLVDYSWAQRGQVVPFTFTPYEGGRSVTGNVKVSPLDIGGDVDKKNTADMKWACVGVPTLGL